MHTPLFAVAAGLVLTAFSTASATPPSDWTMWVEGDPPDWISLNAWVLDGEDSKLPTGSMVIRLIDPDAPQSQGADYVLPSDPGGDLPASLSFIKQLRDGGFTGPISVLPYYDSSGWSWSDNDPSIPQWARPLHWTIKANQLLTAHQVSSGIHAVNYENFGSNHFISVDDPTLKTWQLYMLNIWPDWDASPEFVGIIASKDNKSATNMLRWTTSTRGPDAADLNYFQHPPLVGGMLECYEIYKGNCQFPGGTHTVVDVSNEPHDPPWYPPFGQPQIYEASGHAQDPAGTLLGTPTLDCPIPPATSTLGFLIAVNASPCSGSLQPPDCMTAADMSNITFLFSCDKNLSSKVFGTWDGNTTPATVDQFKSFVDQFDNEFRTYWNAETDKMPRYGIWDFQLLPTSWGASNPSCSGDLTGDFMTNIDDLLAVITLWGEQGGDVNADNQTDVLDLLHVLDNWGWACL